MNKYQQAYQAANDAHDNIVQLYTLLDVLHRRPDCTPTPQQAHHLVHNLLNLEEATLDLRMALTTTLGLIPADPINDLLAAAITLGRQAEHIGDHWQRTGHPPTSNTVQLIEENGTIGAVHTT
jgi:1,6-anhydro-N-acetylmuramate kinase